MDWILVQDGTAERIKEAIFSHAEICGKESPRTHPVRIIPLAAGGHAVEIDGKPHAYEFANLLGWLDQPPDVEGVSGSTGWYTSRSTETRYVLKPDTGNPAGDTLLGVSQAGQSISVYLPELSVSRTSGGVAYLDEPDRVPREGETAMSFEVVLEADESFGNPDFEVS